MQYASEQVRVGRTTHNKNHLDLPKRSLAVEVWDQRSDPGAATERSDQQRKRLTDPRYYEASVRRLKTANESRSWTVEGILEAIRQFNAEFGRPPKQIELRSSNHLPSYQAVWRRFGSIKSATEEALGDDQEGKAASD